MLVYHVCMLFLLGPQHVSLSCMHVVSTRTTICYFIVYACCFYKDHNMLVYHVCMLFLQGPQHVSLSCMHVVSTRTTTC